MSSFSFLNQSPDIEKLEAEEHSREAQIEQCFQLFQEALKLLKAGDYSGADSVFKVLMAQDVIKPNKWGFYAYSSSIVDNLRYLVYRNRGFYYYKYLIQQYYDTLDPPEIVDNVLKMVENLVESLRHSDADHNVIEVLIQIFESFKSKRAQKLLLECEFMSKNSHLYFTGRKHSNILPQLKVLISQYINILNDLHDTTKIEQSNPFMHDESLLTNKPKTDPKYLKILEKLNKLRNEDDEILKTLDIHEIDLSSYDWPTLVRSLRETLPTIKTLALYGRNSDPYAETEAPIEGIKFIVNEDVKNKNATKSEQTESTKGNEQEPNVKKENDSEAKGIVSVSTLPKKRPSTEIEPKQAQRTSKRFRDRGEADSTEDDGKLLFKMTFEIYSQKLNRVEIKTPYEYSDVVKEDPFVENESLIAHHDFLLCMKKWSQWHTDCFSEHDKDFKKNNEDIGKELNLNHFKELLKSSSFQKQKNLQPDISTDFLDSFLANISIRSHHFHEIRFKLLWYLFDNREGGSLLLSTTWNTQMFKDVEWLTLNIERNIFNFIQIDPLKNRFVALAVLEILINLLVALTEELSDKLLLGLKANEQKLQRGKTEKKIKKWFTLFNATDFKDDNWKIRYLWCQYNYLQCIADVKDPQLMEKLNEIKKISARLSNPVSISYGNFEHIMDFSIAIVDSQIKKLNMLNKLASSSEGTECEDASATHLASLENILIASILDNQQKNNQSDNEIEGKLPSDEENNDMIEFLKGAPFMLKFKLWELIYTKYCANSDLQKSTLTFSIMLSLLYETISDETYNSLPEKSRQERLLSTLSLLKNISHQCVTVLKNSSWSQSTFKWYDETMIKLGQFFYILFPMLPCNISPKNGGKTFFELAIKSSKKLKSLFIDVSSLLLFFLNIKLRTISEPEFDLENSIIDLVHYMHTSVGFYKFCDYANGDFLQVSENLICQFTNEKAFSQLKQIMWCKYHFLLSGDSSVVVQHDTKPMEMSKMVSLPLGIYLVKLQYQDKHPCIHTAKISSKQILDTIIETFGDLTTQDSYVMMRNNHSFNSYLKSNITAKQIYLAFEGKEKIELKTPGDEFQKALDAGVFYVAGIQALNLYKIRKKSVQARPSELDAIITMFKNDILYNTRRFESWFLLGRCYSYIVEDDLLWTADKLSSPEKKSNIARHQKQAILCYIMAVTIYFDAETSRTNEEKKVLTECLESLSNELMIAYFKPMEKWCFLPSDSANSSQSQQSNLENPSEEFSNFSIADNEIEEAMLKCYKIANEFTKELLPTKLYQSENWLNYYSSADVIYNSKNTDKVPVLENIKRACEIAEQTTSIKDSVVEPHLMQLYYLYNFMKRDQLEYENCLQMLQENKFFLDHSDMDWSIDKSLSTEEQRKAFFLKIIDLLNHILFMDKKKWQHQPYYFLAKIHFEEFGDINKAKECMDNLVSIKAVNKNLVNIWKPDFERPGQHFVFTYTYVMFYLELLKKDQDPTSIGLVTKKLRRFSSGMAYVSKASEIATSYFLACVSEKYKLMDKAEVELYMSTVYSADFMPYSDEIIAKLKDNPLPEDITEVLRVSYQLKKGTNSVTYDTVCLSIFFQYVYKPYAKDKPSITESAEATKNPADLKAMLRKKVSKKDAFDKIKVFVEKS
ncbi:Histone transcription regulator 3 [Nakaseomyces bracarensis]|uniref:Histone transcription regulator 3 n=1 Tax=Nakaseomyces bracarensis TaxID=273131 RepID=A0ABR4NSY0_9SACH